jgi:hypothetical protein
MHGHHSFEEYFCWREERKSRVVMFIVVPLEEWLKPSSCM